MLRLVGITASEQHEATFNSEELRAILASSAHAGAISARQRQFAENILGFVNLQARHILVPRLEVVWLSVGRPLSENLHHHSGKRSHALSPVQGRPRLGGRHRPYEERDGCAHHE